MLKITQVSPRGQITIPFFLRELFGLQGESRVLIWPKVDSQQIIIKPVRQVDLSQLKGLVKAKNGKQDWRQIRQEVKKKVARKIAAA